MTPFEVLGLRPDADEPDVERAFRALVKRFHPDVTGGTDDETRRRYEEVVEARRQIIEGDLPVADAPVAADPWDDVPEGGTSVDADTPGAGVDDAPATGPLAHFWRQREPDGPAPKAGFW